MKKVKASLLFAVKATIFLMILVVVTYLVVPCNPFSNLFVSVGKILLEAAVSFVFFFLLDYLCRLIFSGRKPNDGVHDAAEEIKN